MRDRMLTRFGRIVRYQFPSTYVPWSRSISSNVKPLKSRESFPQSELIKPELTDSQRKNLTSCCAIELSFNRVSFAKLRLDPQVPERVLLDAWDSIPLKLPTGREFKPHLCMAAAETALRHVEQCSLGDLHLSRNSRTQQDRPKMLFRPVSFDWTRELPITHRIAYAHQSLVLGYLCAMLSNTQSASVTVDWTPNTPTLIAWTGRTQQQWSIYIQDMLRNHPEVHFHLLPCTAQQDSKQAQSIFMHFTSYDLVRGFRLDGMRRKEINTLQFVLARCLLTCLYGLFHQSYSRLL